MTVPRSILVVSHACSRAVNRAPYERLAELGWRVLIVTAESLIVGGRIIPADPPEASGVETRLTTLIGQNARWQRFAELHRIVEDLRPDWVIADIDPHSLLAVELAWAKRRIGFRLGFVTCENLPFGWRALAGRRGLRGLALAAFCSLARYLVRPQTDLVFAINSAGVRLFQDAGFRRVVRTPLGFPERFFRIDPAARTRIRARLRLNGPVIAYFGRMTPEKGVHLLLSALDQLKNRAWHLLLDDFQPVSEYQAMIRRRVDSAAWSQRVHFVEAKHGDVAGFMNAADLVVVPSISTINWVEQYGRVVPEALACGCQVLAADVGALPELLGSYGDLVPENDVAAMVEAIERNLAAHTPAARNSAGSDYANRTLSASAQARLWDGALASEPPGDNFAGASP